MSVLTVADLKQHLRVDISNDDSLISQLNDAAETYIENQTNIKMLVTTITKKLDSFTDVIWLTYSPLVSVTSIKYINSAGDETTLSTDIYDVDTYSTPGRIILAYDKNWPTTQGSKNSITIVYTAGYGTSGTDVPAPLISAIKLLVGHWYRNREAVGTQRLVDVPMAVDSLISAYRVIDYEDE